MARDETVFSCRQCGHCCQGRGGIVLSDGDLARLAEFLAMTADQVIRAYGETSNGKLKIRAGEDGFCIFFRQGQGCSVHEGKPDICRAWPFFRGNLEDPVSLAMARDFCPGIARDISFADFVRAGLAYLQENGLLAKDSRREANSLIIGNLTPTGQQ